MSYQWRVSLYMIRREASKRQIAMFVGRWENLNDLLLAKIICTSSQQQLNKNRRNLIAREKGRYLTQSYDKSPYTDRKIKKKECNNTKTPQKKFARSLTQRLRTDLGRSVLVTIVGQDQVSGGVGVPCWHATSIADALWKLIFRNVKFGK